MIYPAAELLAGGLVPGNINSIGFDLFSKASTQPYNGYTIKVGCTNATKYTSTTWITGLTTVVGPIATTPAVGWNNYLFATPYSWDGVSSLVVEVCFDNTSYSSNDIVNKTTTAYQSCLYDYTDGSSGCILNTPTSSTLRPNTRFENCPVVFPNLYSYTWTPAAYLNNPNRIGELLLQNLLLIFCHLLANL